MGDRTPPEQAMALLLDLMNVEYEEQRKVNGHRIDFVVDVGDWLVCIDTNGDRWHRWSKIRDCDRKKLDRLLTGPELAVPLGVWWSRLKSNPVAVERAVMEAIAVGRVPWWDWAVQISDLSEAARHRIVQFDIDTELGVTS